MLHSPVQDLAAKKQAAMDASLRRICTPKPSSGKLEVSMEIYRQWKAGGAQRKCLLDTLVKAGGNKDLSIHVDSFDTYWKFIGISHLAVYLFLSVSIAAISSTPWRMCSRNNLNTFKRNLADTRCMWRRASTQKRLWRQSLVGASHVLSYSWLYPENIWQCSFLIYIYIYICVHNICVWLQSMWGQL